MKKGLHLLMALLLTIVGIAKAQSITVDFETGDFSQAHFVSESFITWEITNAESSGGTYSMRSGNAGLPSSEAAISVSIYYEVDGDITFDANCQGEGITTFYDICSFEIDGEIKFEHGADVAGWTNYSYPVTAGPHTFTWRYTKDGSVDPTGDAFYVDEITFNGASSTDPFPLYVGFETGNFIELDGLYYNDLMWPWEVTDSEAYEGTHCMKASNTGASYSTATIEVYLNYPVDGYISFYAKCDGSADDRCRFFIDGSEMLNYGDEVEGWHKYAFGVTNGSHTFQWDYDKQNTSTSIVDCFFVDKIEFNAGTPCGAPENLNVEVNGKNAIVTWDGTSSTYKLRYKKTSATSWYVVHDITINEYTIENLTDGDYLVEVMSECEPGVWTSGSFTIYTPASTAKWYAYARYTMGGEPWEHKYVWFTMQNPVAVTAATTDYVSFDVVCGTFANGEVWAYNPADLSFVKAPVSNTYHLVGSFETVATAVTSGFIVAMSYNPANGKMYYVEQTMSMVYVLKCFNLNNPTTVTTCGTIGFDVAAFAINRSGAAYAIESFSGKLYTVNLTNASTALVGETGLAPNSINNSLAFDMVTGELFWSASLPTMPGLYCVDPATAHVASLGQVGGLGAELTSMFMIYDYNDVAESDAHSLSVYPNPANDKLYIDGVEGEQVRVYDNMGRLVMDELYQGHLDVSALAQGVYAVSVGNKVVKFVKK